VITAAALCPSPPLLCPPLTGRQTVLPELHAACAKAAERLMCDSPEMIVIIGPAATTGSWDAATRLNPSVFAPAIASRATGSPPLALGLGGMLLDQAQYRGRRRLQAVAHDEPASTCARLGAELAEASTRTALLVMGDGSARRGEKAPGYLDPRAAAFDAEVERAVRTGSMDALLRLDRELARDLMATGRSAWQVLAGAMDSASPVGEVIYSAAPFGVAYLVAYLSPRRAAP
jgi:hypothetical protein